MDVEVVWKTKAVTRGILSPTTIAQQEEGREGEGEGFALLLSRRYQVTHGEAVERASGLWMSGVERDACLPTVLDARW